jgi:putative ABC transport system ATP-binding protein
VNESATADEREVLVRASGVRKEFSTAAGTVRVLEEVDLEIRKGETVAIVGESGSGKSTLLSLIAGLDTPTSGRIVVDGIDVGAAAESELAKFRSRTIGIVFQHFHLIKSLTALENVALPIELREDPGDARGETLAAQSATDSVGLSHRRDHFPAQLSGGEAQRVAIARAIVGNPALLVADEPTGNLDAKTGTDVMDLLFELVSERGMTLVLVTHSTELAERCDRSLVLCDGRLRDQSYARASDAC